MKKLQILIIAFLISLSICAFASIQVKAATLIVSVSPVGPVTLDVGQVQLFTAASSGGSGSLTYQWYLDNSIVGSNSTSYSYIATVTSHTIYVKVTDSASTPVTSGASNAVSVTVNPVLTPPGVTTSASVIHQGQTSVLSNSSSD